MLCLVKLVLVFVSVCVASKVSDEELHRLPRLFHLDDYDRCLSQKNGLYCVGTFELTPRIEPNLFYNIITEQNKQAFSFDRRLLHRGYCLTKRCQSIERNTTLRFEQCANKLVRNHALTARVKKLSYCRTHADRRAKLTEKPDFPQRLFLYAVYSIMFLNILGTIYDVSCAGKKNKEIIAWSIPANWKSLTTINDADGSSVFAPVQSSKIILHGIIIYTHSTLLHYMSYVHNPEDMEKSRDGFVNSVIKNGTSLVQVFILISSFFTGYNVLGMAQRTKITPAVTVKWILKRIFRIAPVFVLLTAYSATWLPRYDDGPLWTPLVEAESHICRKKFWAQVFFLNNFVDPTELCMVQSWAMATEVQLFLVSLLLTLALMRLRVRAVPVLAGMFTASCLFNVTLAYAAGLDPMVKIIVPEVLRVEFRGSQSLFHLHMSPWSNLPACIFGLLVAHLYFEQKNRKKVKIEHMKASVNETPCQNGLTQDNNPLLSKNEVSGKEDEIADKEKLIGVKENGIANNENGILVKEKRISDKNNGTCDKENGYYAENMLTRRKVTEELNGNGTISNGDLVFSDKTSNGVIRGNAQNGFTKVEKGSKNRAHILLRYAHFFTFPVLLCWVIVGSRVEEVESKPVIALYVGLERLMFSLTFACQLLQVITVRGPWARLLSWRGWTVPARLVLSVAMVHWTVNLTMVAARPHLIASSLLSVSIDWLATLFYSYVIAVPVCLLVELPMKKFVDSLLN